MPFAGYKDFADCVARNQDKDNPEAYCGRIKHQAEGSVSKVDTERQLVFGWASVAVAKAGDPLVDKQGDMIEPDVLEDAAYEFVLNFREADEMHQQVTKGHLVESLAVTPDKLEAMGLAPDALPLGWWLGFKVDADTFAKVKSGHYKMFSIEGTAERVPVEV